MTHDKHEHPVAQEIDSITVELGTEHIQETGARYPESYRVGYDGVTRIEACTKSGMHANIPYVRVWRGDVAVGEWCQHQIVGVYFKVPA